MAELTSVLEALMSRDNGVRRSAEEYFQGQLEHNGLSIVQALLGLLSNAGAPLPLRSFSGVLLRRAIEKSNFGPELDGQLRGALLGIWKTEREPQLLKRMAHVMAQSAMKKDSPWMDLVPEIVAAVKDQGADPQVMVPTLVLVEVLSEYCPGVILTNLPSLGPLLGSLLVSPDAAIQTACARATSACIVSLEDENARNAFKPAVQPIITILGQILSRGDEAEATSIMEYLVTIAEEQPTFFKVSMDSVVAAMLTVAKAEALDFPTRSIALELMVTLTETAPALARRCPGLVEGLVPLAMSLMLDVEEEEEEWAAGKYMEEPEDENYFVGEEAIERAASGMGGRVVAPAVFAVAQQYAASTEWTSRRAAISAICRLAEGSPKPFKAHLPSALQFVGAALSSPSQRVRYQAVETIGRFAALFPADVPEMVALFVPPLTAMMQEGSICERVRGHIAAALINLTDPEHCEAEMLQDHLDPLLRSLSVCLQAASLEVKPFCLDLLGRVAQVSEQAFLPYYSEFMPGIKSILATCTSPELSKLRGKAMSCAGTLSDAVGPAVFGPDALEIMHLILSAMSVAGTFDSDTTFEYILPACARISKTLGAHFEQFLPAVMAPLLASAAQEIQCVIEDAGEDEAEDEGEDEATGMNSMVFDFGAGVKKRITLNTHAIQQKKVTAEMLYEFASSLKGNLKEYLGPCFKAVIPMLTNKHSSDVRSSASLALAKIFEAFIDATKKGFIPPADIGTALSESLTNLLNCMREESNTTSRACAAEALRDVIQACHQSGEEAADGSRGDPLCRPDLANCNKIIHEILQRCSESIARRQKRHQDFSANEALEAEDMGAYAEELEEEEELLGNLTDAMGQLLKLHGEALMPVFDQTIAPLYAPLLADGQAAQLQVIAVCLIDDIIEFGGREAHKYLANALPLFLRNLGSDHPVVRQSSAYGIAQAARVAPEIFAGFLGAMVPALVALVTADNARDDDNEGATENALYAIGIVATNPYYRSVGLGGEVLSQAAGIWLRGLPLRADEHEAKAAHSQLCDSIESSDPAILGEGFANLAEILRIVAEVLGSTATKAGAEGGEETIAHPATMQRMISIVRAVSGGSAGISQQLAEASFAKISAKHQGILHSCLSQA